MFGISAPRVAVRTAVAWYWRWLGLIALAVVIMMFSAKAKLEQEVAQISGNLAQIERQMQIERATYTDLVKQVKALTEENASLKEDLAFFQTLMPSGGKEGGVAVNRFMVQNDALPGEFRYRLLLTQTGQRSKDFQGRLQFVVNLQQDGKKTVMTLPADDD